MRWSNDKNEIWVVDEKKGLSSLLNFSKLITILWLYENIFILKKEIAKNLSVKCNSVCN